MIVRDKDGNRWIPTQGPFVPVPVSLSLEVSTMADKSTHPANADTPPVLDDSGKALLRYLGIKSLQVNKFAGKLEGSGGGDSRFQQDLQSLVALEFGEDVARATFDDPNESDDQKAAKIYDANADVAPTDMAMLSTERRNDRAATRELAECWAQGKLSSADLIRLSTEPPMRKSTLAKTYAHVPAGRVPDHVIAKQVDDQLRASGRGRFATTG